MFAEFSFQFLHLYLSFNFDTFSTFFVDFYVMNMTSKSEQKKKIKNSDKQNFVMLRFFKKNTVETIFTADVFSRQ